MALLIEADDYSGGTRGRRNEYTNGCALTRLPSQIAEIQSRGFVPTCKDGPENGIDRIHTAIHDSGAQSKHRVRSKLLIAVCVQVRQSAHGELVIERQLASKATPHFPEGECG